MNKIFALFLFLSLLFCTGDMVNEIFTTTITSTGFQSSQSFKKKHISDDHWINFVSQKESHAAIDRLIFLLQKLYLYVVSSSLKGLCLVDYVAL